MIEQKQFQLTPVLRKRYSQNQISGIGYTECTQVQHFLVTQQDHYLHAILEVDR